MNKGDMPLVSVVTPSYNHGRYLEETILSVLNQNYPFIEYIVVDGASTDNSIDILKKYDGKIKWISEKDKSTEDAVNKGFAMATGEIFAWIAADDTYLPGAVEKIVRFFKDHSDTDMVYGRAYYIDAAGKVLFKCPTAPFDYDFLAVENFIIQPAAFFEREAFYGAGSLSTDYRYATDYDLWVRMARKRYHIEYIAEFLANYRLHDDAQTVGVRGNKLKSFEEFIAITKENFHWVPVNRVYPYCWAVIKSRLPARFSAASLLVKFLAAISSIPVYFYYNRTIKRGDIKALPRNLKKFFFGWQLSDYMKQPPKELTDSNSQ